MSQLVYNPIAVGVPAASPSGLSCDGAGHLTVVLANPPIGATLAVGLVVTIISAVLGGNSFQISAPISTLTNQTHFVLTVPASLASGTGGGGTLFVSPAQFYDLADSVLSRDAAFTQDIATKLARNGFFGAVRCEVFDAGWWTHGNTIPPPVSPVDNYVYQLSECIFVPILGSSRQPPKAQFAPGQVTFPVLSNADKGNGNLLASPYELAVAASTGVLTATFNFDGSGVTGQGTVKVFIVGQRQKGSLAMGASPAFTDIPDGSLVGGNFLGQTLTRQLNQNAKFGAVRLEVFGPNYYADGDTPAIPTSPVDGYAYSAGECLFLPVLASALSPSSYTPGQSTFPSPGGGQTDLLESPYKLAVVNGVLKCKMYSASAGLVSQGTVAVFTFAQRGSVQAQG